MHISLQAVRWLWRYTVFERRAEQLGRRAKIFRSTSGRYRQKAPNPLVLDVVLAWKADDGARRCGGFRPATGFQPVLGPMPIREASTRSHGKVESCEARRECKSGRVGVDERQRWSRSRWKWRLHRLPVHVPIGVTTPWVV
jgi:hypothetical protein